MKKLIIIIQFLLLVSGISTGQSKVGTSAVDFLGIGIGPRAIGMGSAVVSLQTGPAAMYWNPGVLGLDPKTEITFNNMNWLVGSKYNWIGATIAISDASVFGISICTCKLW